MVGLTCPRLLSRGSRDNYLHPIHYLGSKSIFKTTEVRGTKRLAEPLQSVNTVSVVDIFLQETDSVNTFTTKQESWNDSLSYDTRINDAPYIKIKTEIIERVYEERKSPNNQTSECIRKRQYTVCVYVRVWTGGGWGGCGGRTTCGFRYVGPVPYLH